MNRKAKTNCMCPNEGITLSSCDIARRIETDVAVLNLVGGNEKTEERVTVGLEVEKAS